GNLSPLIAKIAFVFVLIGYGTKVGFAPMHTWKPDAYSKAPAPLGALLSGALLPVAFFVLLKFKMITDLSIGSSFSQTLFFVFGLFSIAVASLIMFNARNYKRLLAYSSIENAGIMALGFGFGGLGIFGAVLHMIYHSAVKVVMFFSAGNILLKYSTAKICNIKNALKVIPTTSVLFILGFLIVTGTPPFGIFFSKIYILGTGIKMYPLISFVAMFFMTMVFIGFLRHVTQMFLSRSSETQEPGEGNVWLVIPPIFFLLLIILLSFSIPPFLEHLIHEVVLYYSYD
ncbi:MAG: hydrogenase, partial [Candidatus Moranbacteria bacterium CG17_big_fil_post_rev_8_21_14_2_50_41_107]